MKTTATPKPLSTPSRRLSPQAEHKLAFDDLVKRASRGDRDAIAAIVLAFGPDLREQARADLKPWGDEAEDLVQDFFLHLLEGRWRYVPDHAGGSAWMRRVIRTMAATRRAERQRDWGNWGDP